jgi:hypothetical protein
VLNLLTDSQVSVYGGIIRARLTFLCIQIEDRIVSGAIDALISIEEGKCDRAIGNILIADASLIVFLNDIINSLISKDPIGSIDIALKDRGLKMTVASNLVYIIF